MLAMDKFIMLMQEVWSLFGRVFRMKRSLASKITSYELPAPVVGQALAWTSQDNGLTFQLGNRAYDLISAIVNGILPGGALAKNEVPVGLVNSTTGSDGNGVFTFAFTPLSVLLFDLLVD